VDGFVDDLWGGAFVGVDGGDEVGVSLAYTVADGLGGVGCTGTGFARLRTALRGVSGHFSRGFRRCVHR
jgi:hypothetical protein